MSTSRLKRHAWLSFGALIAFGAAWLALHRASEPTIDVAPRTEANSKEPARASNIESVAERATRETVASEAAVKRARIHVVGLPARTPIEGALILVRATNANVTIESRTGPDNAIAYRTDVGGIAEVDIPTSRDWFLDLSADGYFSIGDVKSEVEAGAEFTYELQSTGRLHVRVLEADGKPIAKAFVEVWPGDGSSPNGRARLPRVWPAFYSPRIDWHGRKFDALHQLSGTDEKGELWIESLPCDVPLTVTASEAVAPIKVETTIPSDARMREIELSAFAHGCLRGRIVWDDGAPANHIAVTPFVDDARGASRAPVFSDKDGRFEMCGLPHARVAWRIDVPGELSRSTLIDAPIVDVGEIRMPRLEELELHAHGSHLPAHFGYYAVQARIYHDGKLIEMGGKIQNFAPVGFDDEGRFKTRVPAGATRIDVLGLQGVRWSRVVEVPTPTVEIDLDAMSAALRIAKPPIDKQRSFSVMLCPDESTARALGDGCLIFYSWSAGERMSWIDDDLSILLLDPGGYEVFSAVDDGAKLDLGHVTLVAGETATLVPGDVRLATVQGRLIDANSNPIEHGTLIAVHPALEHLRERKRRTMITAKDGTFEMKDVLPGRWTIFPDSLGPDSAEAKTIDLKPGDEVSLDLVVERVGKIGGHVRVAGRPFAKASICVYPWRQFVSDASNRVTQTDSSGAYAIEKLYPGRYQVDATASDDSKNFWAVQVRNVELHPGESLDVDFEPGVGLLRLRVELDGQPLTDPTEWSGGIACTDSGACWMHPVVGEPSVFTAKLDPGPCLVMLVAPKSFPTREPLSEPSCYSFAYVDSIEPGAQEVVANVHGGELVVRATVDGAPLPWARVLRVKSVVNLFANTLSTGVVYVDDQPGVRRFPSIPLGATLQLSSSYPPSSRDALEVHVDSTEPVIVDWPPKR